MNTWRSKWSPAAEWVGMLHRQKHMILLCQCIWALWHENWKKIKLVWLPQFWVMFKLGFIPKYSTGNLLDPPSFSKQRSPFRVCNQVGGGSGPYPVKMRDGQGTLLPMPWTRLEPTIIHHPPSSFTLYEQQRQRVLSADHKSPARRKSHVYSFNLCQLAWKKHTPKKQRFWAFLKP